MPVAILVTEIEPELNDSLPSLKSQTSDAKSPTVQPSISRSKPAFSSKVSSQSGTWLRSISAVQSTGGAPAQPGVAPEPLPLPPLDELDPASPAPPGAPPSSLPPAFLVPPDVLAPE